MSAFALSCFAEEHGGKATVFSFEHYAIVHGKYGPTPALTGYLRHDMTERHGMFLFGRGERPHRHNDGDMIAGYINQVAKGVHLGIGAGVNQAFAVNRAGAIATVHRMGIEAHMAYDIGRGRPWHTVVVNSPSWKGLGARFQSEPHIGSGPGANFSIGKSLTFWAAMPYDSHYGVNPVFGVAVRHRLPFPGRH